MVKVKLESPANTFPYKISRRLDILSKPKKYFKETGQYLPALTSAGVRLSAVSGSQKERSYDIAWPYLRRLVMVKRLYKNKFSQERMEKLDRMIEASNATMYSKLANCAIDIRKKDVKDTKRKKAWSESEWKRHMEYINQIAGAKKSWEPEAITRGERKPIEELLPRINFLLQKPDFKFYRRMSQEAWYRDPIKVSKNAMKYQISDRMKRLAEARPTFTD